MLFQIAIIVALLINVPDRLADAIYDGEDVTIEYSGSADHIIEETLHILEKRGKCPVLLDEAVCNGWSKHAYFIQIEDQVQVVIIRDKIYTWPCTQ